MIIENTTYRKPSIVSEKEIKELMIYIESEIRNFMKGGIDNFIVKDLFGYENWDWCELKLPISILYENWYNKYINDTNACIKNWNEEKINFEAQKQAGISLGYIVKMVVKNMPEKFHINNETGWNIRYTLV